MQHKKALLIPSTILAITALGPTPVAFLHDGVASGTCNGGVQWAYSNYDKTVVNSITVTIDGTVRWQDLDFKSSAEGQILTDKTIPHTWDVAVNAPGTAYDKHPSGSYPACQTAPTTTVAETHPPTTPAPEFPNDTTTTVQADPTTTTVVAVDIPPVPTTLAPSTALDVVSLTPDNPTLPTTGADGFTVGLAVVAAGCLVVGVYLAIRGRRVP